MSADSIAVMEGGKVVEQGSYYDLLENDNGVFCILTESLRN